MAELAASATSGKVVIKNIGLLLSGDIDHPILEADTVIVNDGLIVAVDGATLRIVPRAPHGWLIVRGAETLGMHAGVPGLLRQLREELAPHAKVGRLIIGAQSLP